MTIKQGLASTLKQGFHCLHLGRVALTSRHAPAEQSVRPY